MKKKKKHADCALDNISILKVQTQHDLLRGKKANNLIIDME